MARPNINRAGEMEMFVRVVELGGFSAAASAMGVTPSAVSKLVSRLEARLGVRLAHRSTRRLVLTPEGQDYHQRALRILTDLDEAERNAGAGEQLAGRLRVSSSASYVAHVLAPILPDFLHAYPDIMIEIVQTDTVIDLLAERTDIAVRAGPMPSSRLMARKLGQTRMMIVATPAWIARHGMPATPAELLGHDRIGFAYARATNGWPVVEHGRETLLSVTDRVQVSDGEGIRRLALAGVGVARLATFTIGEDLAAGRLVPLLENHNPGDIETFHAVFLGQSGQLPARARVFLDFLAERGRVA
ncbi:LysR family transcriptional regulator [Sphingomonas sp. So64.6b]|uniref:LysR family transcriptional regulator n=1 Tax=Sphingomonas sp. So64.6b TaxID=2997354 RepID=UPI001601B936|nr:LysR family transcriptional regulator [Sphingomonas sp. So64.6b]QNA85276.1 LysR family transcriptional regulator [Sphingomonas sp. So64.6b]